MRKQGVLYSCFVPTGVLHPSDRLLQSSAGGTMTRFKSRICCFMLRYRVRYRRVKTRGIGPYYRVCVCLRNKTFPPCVLDSRKPQREQSREGGSARWQTRR